MKYESINPELFRINRRRFTREMKSDSIAVFLSNDQMPRNGDQFFPFRQNSDLFALSGLDQEECILLLFPDCVKEDMREIVFIRRSSEHIATWEGHKYSKAEARQISGVQKVHWTDEFEAVFKQLAYMARTIYLNTNENDKFHTDVRTKDLRFADWVKEQYPAHHHERAQPILKQLAMIKLEYELELIERAIEITNKAFHKVLRFVRPGVMEYEVEAEIIGEFIRNRSTGHAYMPIVASGQNACTLHYNDNNQQCHDGDLLLMDFGAEYANYAADLTRTIPVNGRFSERQRAVYNAVLRVFKESRQMLVPGTLLDDFNKEVGLIMESELIGLGLISKEDVKNQDPNKPTYKKYFMHGTAHHLGLDVHDLSDKYVPFQAGMVFTCEPGIYIPEENIGVRIENDILVTDHDPVDLMVAIPVEAEEIEELMNAPVLSGE